VRTKPVSSTAVRVKVNVRNKMKACECGVQCIFVADNDYILTAYDVPQFFCLTTWWRYGQSVGLAIKMS